MVWRKQPETPTFVSDTNRVSLHADSYRQGVYLIGSMGLERRDRTALKTGKTTSRYSISIKTEPVLLDISPNRLGEGPAKAILEFLKRKIQNISAVAKPSTLARRKASAEAFARSEPDAVKKYSGGKMGPMAPNQSVRLFNDSGRLAQGLFVRANTSNQVGGAAWTINVPANRLDPRTVTGGESGVAKMYERLVAFVPELADAKLLLAVDTVRQAITDAVDGVMIQELGAAQKRRGQLKAQLFRGYVQIAQQLLRGVTF